MLADMRERARSEGGFTLIELLVVMIIIAILMAVAIPTFLAQKNNAQKTKTTANIKQIVNAIEACAANNTDGTYTGAAGGTNCTTWATITGFEKGLVSVPNGTALNQYQVAAIGTQGYQVAGSIQDGDQQVWFAERHQEDGSLMKICGTGTTAAGISASAGAAVAGSRTCTNGRWG